jgi:hypothetical protein
MHTGGGARGEGGRVNIGPPPQANFKTLVNKNAIKTKIRRTPGPGQFSLKPLTPSLGILAKTLGTPSPGFSTPVHLVGGLLFSNLVPHPLSLCIYVSSYSTKLESYKLKKCYDIDPKRNEPLFLKNVSNIRQGQSNVQLH